MKLEVWNNTQILSEIDGEIVFDGWQTLDGDVFEMTWADAMNYLHNAEGSICGKYYNSWNEFLEALETASKEVYSLEEAKELIEDKNQIATEVGGYLKISE